MYYVDRTKIESVLEFLTTLLPTIPTIDLQDKKDLFVLERVSHLVIEAVLDVGNSMIDGFIMRDPGSYEDIIDILEDEKVLRESEAKGLKRVISLRKMLVQEYLYVDHKQVYQTYLDEIKILENYPKQIRRYLDEELGPVSAFKN